MAFRASWHFAPHGISRLMAFRASWHLAPHETPSRLRRTHENALFSRSYVDDVAAARTAGVVMTKAYVATTVILFGALTVLHAWRAAIEPPSRDPEFLVITAVAAAFTVWGARVWLKLTARNI
jgi:hypothetical protein